MLRTALLSALLLAAAAAAQEVPRSVKVGLYISPPFVMEEDGRITGMAVDLWEEVAARENLESDYRVVPNVQELIEATSRGDVDVAVTNLAVTQERIERIDFTHPWFDAGLRIMVDKDRNAGFWAVVAGLKNSGHLSGYAWLLSIILLTTVLFTLFDRRFDEEFPRRWRDGLAESFYSVMSITTSGEMKHKNLFGWIGRIWQGIWLVFGVAVVAYITASVTSVMTSLSLTTQINGPRDLSGKTVGVFSGSVAEEFARGASIASHSYEGIDDAVQALKGGAIDAVVADAPVLAYYAHTHPEASVRVVGRIFEPDKYAFSLPKRSDLTRPLSVEIIGADESGRVAELRKKYFGERGK